MEKPRKYFLIGIFTSVLSAFLFKILEIDYMFWLSIFAFLGLTVALISWHLLSEDDKVKIFKNKINDYITENKIIISNSSLSDSHNGRLILDHENKNLWIFRNMTNGEIEIQNVNYTQITESTLIENGNTVTKTSRGSQVAGAVVGGAVLGGVGAVIGGLSGKQKSHDTVKTLELKVVTNDLNNAVSTFGFKDSLNEFEKDSSIYRQLYNDAYEIHKIISIIIKQQDKKQIQ